MITNLISYLALAALILTGAAFIYLHWRYHPHSTLLDSFDLLQKQLQQGTPTILQFHAPL